MFHWQVSKWKKWTYKIIALRWRYIPWQSFSIELKKFNPSLFLIFQGIFRLACEHTLRVMRRGRETLLTLLEAFVYDPLVDWRAGAENSIATTYGACQAPRAAASAARCGGAGRKQLELELTAAMFAVRVAEMRAEWLANKDELAKSFPALSCSLTRWVFFLYKYILDTVETLKNYSS